MNEMNSLCSGPPDLQQVLGVLADPGSSRIARLRASVLLTRIGEASQAQAVLELGEADGWPVDLKDFYDIEPKLIRIGADGTVLWDETMPLEVAGARETSVMSATWFIRDVVNLASRHRYSWEAVQECRIPLWQGLRVALKCAGLSPQQCEAVDALVAPALGRVGLKRIDNLVRAAVMKVAPEMVEDQANRSPRFCRKETSEAHPGTMFIQAALDTGDGVFFDATVSALADELASDGDTRELDERRASAMGIMGNPALALAILGRVHTRRGMDPEQVVEVPTVEQALKTSPVANIYVHVSGENLEAGEGVARVENLGPTLVTQLSKLVGHTRIKITPVIWLGDNEPVVDAYEIPRLIRETVWLRDRYEVSPFSTREARKQDLDHSNPYRVGVPGQTRPSNLGPLSRKAHRAKTLSPGWRLIQTEPGVFWWKTRLGQVFRVGPEGTTNHTNYNNT